MTAVGRLGFRVRPAGPRLPAATLARFTALASAGVADAMGRFNFMDPGLRARTGQRAAGPALTVVCRPGDNLMVHKALALASPGDVVVVTTGGNVTSAVFGELMCESAIAARVGALVVDGAVRDVEAIASKSFAVFSRSVSPGGCDKDGPGEINVPVACGGVVAKPGDVVVGDSDGVAVVPYEEADLVLQAVDELMERERRRVAEIRGGQVFRPDVDDLLRRKGVIE
jgi:4-hydroxy-4-methyl-2-oxoglutarate aldolase